MSLSILLRYLAQKIPQTTNLGVRSSNLFGRANF